MTKLSLLSAADQAIVDAKLAEIERKSGKAWACELTQHQQANDHGYLLEVTVNGHFLRPVSLLSDGCGERICCELDRLANLSNL